MRRWRRPHDNGAAPAPTPCGGSAVWGALCA